MFTCVQYLIFSEQQCCSIFYDARKWSDWLRALCREKVIISKMAATWRLHSAAMRDFVLLFILIGSQQQVNPAACKLQLELQVKDITFCSSQKCAWRNTMRCAACSAGILALQSCTVIIFSCILDRRASFLLHFLWFCSDGTSPFPFKSVFTMVKTVTVKEETSNFSLDWAQGDSADLSEFSNLSHFFAQAKKCVLKVTLSIFRILAHPAPSFVPWKLNIRY
jgi:hypothetical protein